MSFQRVMEMYDYNLIRAKWNPSKQELYPSYYWFKVQSCKPRKFDVQLKLRFYAFQILVLKKSNVVIDIIMLYLMFSFLFYSSSYCKRINIYIYTLYKSRNLLTRNKTNKDATFPSIKPHHTLCLLVSLRDNQQALAGYLEILLIYGEKGGILNGDNGGF